MKFGYPFDFGAWSKLEDLKLYHELAEYYFAIEEVTRNIPREIEFLKEFFPHNSFARLVDLGCGTGEHVSLLQQSGYNVMGIDYSNHMLRIARNRFPSIRVIQDNIARLTFTGIYDGFYSLFGTLNYIFDDMILKKILRTIGQRLRQKGRFILDVWNAEPIRRIKNKPMTNVSSIIFDKKVIHRNRGFQVMDNDSMTIVKVNYLYQIDDKELEDCHFMRAFNLAELERILNGSCFGIVAVYKNFSREEFDPLSNRIVVVLEKS